MVIKQVELQHVCGITSKLPDKICELLIQLN